MPIAVDLGEHQRAKHHKLYQKKEQAWPGRKVEEWNWEERGSHKQDSSPNGHPACPAGHKAASGKKKEEDNEGWKAEHIFTYQGDW